MNEDLNSTTHKYPRTLREAFPDDKNPYEDFKVKPDYMNWVFGIVYVFCIVVMLLDFFVWRP